MKGSRLLRSDILGWKAEQGRCLFGSIDLVEISRALPRARQPRHTALARLQATKLCKRAKAQRRYSHVSALLPHHLSAKWNVPRDAPGSEWPGLSPGLSRTLSRARRKYWVLLQASREACNKYHRTPDPKKKNNHRPGSNRRRLGISSGCVDFLRLNFLCLSR